jgi:cobalt-zinc-cadmium efflux system protein
MVENLKILMQGVPSHIDINHIHHGLMTVKGVVEAHDMHVWSMDGEIDIFTGHIVVTDTALKDPEKMKELIKTELTLHHIEHSTIELESESFDVDHHCPME